MHVLSANEIEMVGGAAWSDAEMSVALGGAAAMYGGAAAIPSPLSPVLGLIGAACGIGSAYYAWQAL